MLKGVKCMTVSSTLQRFKALMKKIKAYDEALGVLYWDMRTGAPKKGIETRSEVVGLLSAERFQLSVSLEMGELLSALSEHMDELSPVEQRMVTECKKEYERSRKIPPERYEEYVVLTSKAEAVWEEAKQNADFESFRPYLEQIVAFNREFISYWGTGETPYDALLDMYEPGMTIKQLDAIFGSLKEELVPLVEHIAQSPHQPDTRFLRNTYDLEKQRQFSLFILKEMGYDFDAGRLDVSVHPFATGLNPGDVRITTNYLPHDFAFSLFSSIHEGGHALYEQNISPDLVHTNLGEGASMAVHESQSRFWENMIGRSLPFWRRYYPDLQKTFKEQLQGASLEQFYRAINEVKPSLIRIEADELTYNLHIMIRYELEKALFNEGLRVDELPDAWNAKYKAYLNVEPAHDGEGVLQDVHWSGGAFGYFPSYSLGNMYAAQIMHALRKEMPDMDARIEAGELAPIKDWLKKHIYQHGMVKTPAELIEQTTGEALNPVYLTNYLQKKYKEIYKL